VLKYLKVGQMSIDLPAFSQKLGGIIIKVTIG
jgi:hypothetical protein